MAGWAQPFLLFLAGLRRSLRLLGASIAALTLVFFFFSGRVLAILQHHLGDTLYFFSVAEPFLVHVKIALFGALFVLMPLCMHVLWKAAARPFDMGAGRIFAFVCATCLLFYAGVVFCYLVTLPFGVQFLLSFQSESLRPVISIGRFANFVLLFLLGCGLVFQLPVFMIFAAQAGIIPLRAYIRNRRYAVLIIAILAAVLTPTPDVVNMGLMGLPLYLLYESGILLCRCLGLGTKPGGNKPEQGQNGL